MLSLLFLACIPESTLISGMVMDSQDAGTPAPGVTVTTLDGGGMEWATTTTDDSGTFVVDLPIYTLFYLEAAADGFVPTVFSGFAENEPLEVQDGSLWMRTPQEHDELAVTFGDCAAEAGEGGVIEGEVRMLVIQTPDLSELPLVTTASVLAYTADGTPYSACYLDDEGISSAEAFQTGETGRFAIFGVPDGLISLQVRYDYGGSEDQEDWYPIYMPDNGTVPLWPALVSLPGS